MCRYFTILGFTVIGLAFFCSCSKGPMEQGEALITYEHISLGGIALQDTVGSCFSTATGTVVRARDLGQRTGPEVDIVFVGLPGVRFFESPDAVTYWGLEEVPGARHSSFVHLGPDSRRGFTVADFDRMTDDALLSGMEIVEDHGGLPLDGLPFLVLFKNADGKKGAIKIIAMKKAGASSEIIFDLKMQP